jgi:hypothetical protein
MLSEAMNLDGSFLRRMNALDALGQDVASHQAETAGEEPSAGAVTPNGTDASG